METCRRKNHCTLLYKILNGEYVLADLKTPATEEQVEQKESKIAEYEKREYLAQHIILSTTSTHLGAKIKDLTSANDMWKIVVADTTMKSTLYLINAEDQLSKMKLAKNNDAKAHLSELQKHFKMMVQHHDNLIKMGSSMSNNCFNTLIMSSLPESY